MRLLLDSHSLLWAVFEPQKLSAETRRLIANRDNIVYSSIASLWEISIKHSLGRLDLPDQFFDTITHGGYELLHIAIPHIKIYASLPLHHRDPFDRILVAQAIAEQLTIITRDPEVQQYDVRTLPA